MSKKTGYLLGILLTIIIGMILTWLFCCKAADEAANADANVSDRGDQKVVAPPPAATSMGFNLTDPDDGNFAFSSNENFNFNSSQFNILQPISSQLDQGIDKLLAHLNKEGNSGKMIDIRGYYGSEEENTSALANLGLARATAVKNYFINKGIPSARMNTFGELKAALVPDGDIYRGPLSFSIKTQVDEAAVKEAAELQALADRLKADPLVLYFNNAQSSINLTAEQRQKIGDISRYLDKVAGAAVNIVGHSDNTGSRATNIPLGLKRANFAKNYLVQNGIAAERIKTSSMGPDEPIATNDTEAGRSKNRRCVVTLN